MPDKLPKQPMSDRERRLKRLKALETRVPAVKKISQHPKYGHWAPVLYTALEVGGAILGVILITQLFRLIPSPDLTIPKPDIHIPFPDLPKINLPSINLPDLPKLPGWLDTLMDIFFKTLPIWVAIGFAIYSGKQKKKK